MDCPQCSGSLAQAGSDWLRCSGCRYEIDAGSWQVHARLLSELDTDPDRFFARVRSRLEHLRSLEPAWQRV
ncbi:hypothetical protein ACWCQM_04465 [Streptomyces sp. NPDC002125]